MSTGSGADAKWPIKYLRTKSYGIRDRDGRLDHIGAIQDVTDTGSRKRQLAKARSELAHVASVATRYLNGVNRARSEPAALRYRH